MSDTKLGNPAVVGLAGFGLTTLTLQLFNLGWVTLAPVVWLGIIFGGGAQLAAGLMEFRAGNNFGFAAFAGYGAFWISFSLMLIFGTNTALTKTFGALKLGPHDVGWFLVGWTIFTAILLVGAMRRNTALSIVFLTLLLGFIGLDLKELAGMASAGTFASWDLIVCGFSALYLMAANVYVDVGPRLPIGGAWLQ